MILPTFPKTVKYQTENIPEVHDRASSSAGLTTTYKAVCPNLIGLWAGETPCQRSTTSRQGCSQWRAAVCEEGLQVAEPSVKD